jgi:hypothetical protein
MDIPLEKARSLKTLIILILWVSLLASSAVYALDIIKIRPINHTIDSKLSYKYQLLELLLKTTEDKYGAYEIHFVNQLNSQQRDIKHLDLDIINVFISMTSKAREETMLPVRIPVFKGLYGYRVFLINKNDQSRFSDIKTLDQLKKLTAVQGTHWPDLNILKSNGLNIESSSQHESLFKMLEYGRVDYFPRGIHEPWRELSDRPELALTVEKNLVLYYPAPGYIFVKKDNLHLSRRLKEGFQNIIESGEFDAFFNHHPQIIEMRKKSNLENRTLFKLNNPSLSPFTPLDDKRLWYQINNDQ